MRTMEKLPIDGERLKNSLKKRGYTLQGADAAMGYKKALSNFLRYGSITKPAMTLLDSVIGIPYEEYEPMEPEAKPELTVDVLQAVVYHAVQDYCEAHLPEVIEEAIRKMVG